MAPLFQVKGCATCHSGRTTPIVAVGPPLVAVSSWAGDRSTASRRRSTSSSRCAARRRSSRPSTDRPAARTTGCRCCSCPTTRSTPSSPTCSDAEAERDRVGTGESGTMTETSSGVLKSATPRRSARCCRVTDSALRIAAVVLGGAVDADDVVQIASERSWRAIGDVDARGFRSWFLRRRQHGAQPAPRSMAPPPRRAPRRPVAGPPRRPGRRHRHGRPAMSSSPRSTGSTPTHGW